MGKTYNARKRKVKKKIDKEKILKQNDELASSGYSIWQRNIKRRKYSRYGSKLRHNRKKWFMV